MSDTSNPAQQIINQELGAGTQEVTNILSAIMDGFLDVIGAIFALKDVITGAGAILSQQFLHQFQADHTDALILPPDLADMMERNIFDAAGNATLTSGAILNAYQEAARSGLSSDKLDLLTLDTGEPYGIMEALALLRRGDIALAEFTKVLYYSRVRNEFLDDVLKLQYSFMSPADAVEIALKGIETEDVAKELFIKAGGYADNWDDLLAAAGNPIGVVNAVNQYYHGVIDYATVNSVILHSRINPMFEDLALNEHLKWLTATQIHQAVKAGTVDPITATGWLIEDGYDATQAAAFAGSANAEAVAGSKNLAESLIAEAYTDKVLDTTSATLALTQIGYSPSAISIILATQDAKQQMAITKVAVSKVRSLMVAGRITATQAGAELAQLGLPQAAINQYTDTWAIEASANVKTLTEAQVGRLYAKGVIDSAAAIARWEQMGYSASDAQYLISVYETAKSQA